MKLTSLKAGVLLLGLTALTGCDIEGGLHVNQSATLIDKTGRQVPIVAGQTYRTELGKDGDKLKFNIEIGGKEREIRLSPPPGSKLPKYAGELTIPAARSGQPVDFHGVIDTQDYDGRPQRGTQSCTTTAQIRVCQQVAVPVPAGRPPRTEERCSFENRTVSGNQEIEYFDRTTTTTADVQLLAPSSRSVVATFNGSKSSSQRITTWSGRCETPYDGGGWDRPGRPPRDPRGRR
jgi:hypothetical protein